MRAEATDNPYPGLFYYTHENSHLYFGREGQSDALVARLARSRFLAVVGTSGSGKSSLVRAGLLPSLWAGYLGSAGSDWLVADVRPGSDPIDRLAAELARLACFGEQASLEARLRESSLALAELVRTAKLDGTNLLLLVDQFEELFRFDAHGNDARQNQGERASFVKLLLEATSAEQLPVYVVITMRSDFLGDCAAFRHLPEVISESQYLVPRMTRDQLRAAIEGPARVAGGTITNRLVQQLLNDAASNQDQDQLPLLQHVLMRTWDAWCRDPESSAMDLAHYDAVGTIADALSRHAEEASVEAAQRVPAGNALVKTIFQRLAGRDHEGRETRRECTVKELVAVTKASLSDVTNCLQSFRSPRRAFLMPLADKRLVLDTEIDITHECLLRRWTTLRDNWVPEELDSARMYRKLMDRAEDGTLMTGRALSSMLDWWKTRQPTAAWATRYSGDFEKAERFKQKSQFYRTAKYAVASMLTVLLIAFGAKLTSRSVLARQDIAVKEALATEERKKRDDAMTLVMARTAASLVSDPSLVTVGALLAAATLHREKSVGTTEALDVLVRAQSLLPRADRRIALETKASKVAFGDHGKLVAVADEAGHVSLWDTGTLKLVGGFDAPGETAQLEFSGDGSRIAVGTYAGASVFRLEDFKATREFRFDCEPLANWASLAGTGDVLAVTCGPPTGARVFRRDGTTWRADATMKRSGQGWAVSRDGKEFSAMLSRDNGEMEYRVWRGTRRTSRSGGIPGSMWQWENARKDLTRFVWTSGNSTLEVAVARDADLQGYAADAPIRITAAGEVENLLMDDNGARLVATSTGGVVQLWSLPDAVELLKRRYGGTIHALAFDGESAQIALGFDKEVALLQLGVAQEGSLRRARITGGGVVGTSTARDRLLMMRFQGEGRAPTPLPVDGCPFASFAALDSAASNLAYVACPERSIDSDSLELQVIELRPDGSSGTPRSAMRMKITDAFRLRSFAVGTEGRRVAALFSKGLLNPLEPRGANAEHQELKVQELRFAEVGSAEKQTEAPGDVSYWQLTPSGTRVWAVVRDTEREQKERVVSYSIETNEWLDARIPVEGRVTAFAVSRDEEYVALATLDDAALTAGSEPELGASSRVQIWSVKEKRVVTLTTPGTTTAIAFAPDGAHVATADGSTVRVWDVKGAQLARVVLGSAVSGVGFSPDGHQVIAVAGDRVSTLLWEGDELVSAVCKSAGRDLTFEEWRKYVPDLHYQPVCKGFAEPAHENRRPGQALR